VIAFVAVLGAAGLLGATLSSGSGGRRIPADPSRDPTAAGPWGPELAAALEAKVARLERQIAALSASHIAAARGAPAAGAPASPPASGSAPPSDPGRARNVGAPPSGEAPPLAGDVRRQAARALEQMYASLDRRLADERPDPAWRPEGEMSEALAALASRPDVTSVRCAAVFCRVELVFGSAEARAGTIEEIGRRPPFTQGILFRHGPDEPARLTLYVQRPGHVLGDEMNVPSEEENR
jgi:hypothetical protein